MTQPPPGLKAEGASQQNPPRASGWLPFALLGRALLFFAPILLPICFLEICFRLSGENLPVRTVVRLQRENDQALFLRAFFDQQSGTYKTEQIKAMHPRIVALGSSRVMKFRSEMFGEGKGSFVNGTGMLGDIGDLADYVELYAGHYPRVVILGIDPWFLNDRFRSFTAPLKQRVAEDAVDDWKGHAAAIRAALDPRSFSKLWLAAKTHDAERIGVMAAVKAEGYRWDGSFKTSLPLPPSPNWGFVEREQPAIVERIKRGTARFERTQHISEPKFRTLSRSIQELASRGVRVIAFLPPLASEPEMMLQTLPEYKTFWREYKERTRRLCEDLNVPFLDATSLARFGLDDRFMYDGIHAEETFHLYLLRELLKDRKASAILPRAGAAVEAALANPRTNFYYAQF